eukprot:COSAG02_NODE_10086_length_2029_cov_3.344560_1_plen_43_part_10
MPWGWRGSHKLSILLGMHGKFLIFNSEFAPSTIISLTGFFSLR